MTETSNNQPEEVKQCRLQGKGNGISRFAMALVSATAVAA